MASASLAVVGWAVGYEAFANFAWQVTADSVRGFPPLPKRLLRALSATEKTEVLLECAGNLPGGTAWKTHLDDLFAARNRLVHYKATNEYLGSASIPALGEALRLRNLVEWRSAAAQGIRLLAKPLSPDLADIGFVDGTYNLESVG